MLPSPAADRTAVVTGASSGIGLELARILAHRGHQVVLIARRADLLRDVAATIGPGAHVLPADLSDAAARASLPERIAGLGLTVDILVNSAGLATMGPVSACDPEAELNQVEVNVAAVVDLCSRFVPAMVARNRGAVLNVASVGAFGPVPGQAVYGASKAFVLSYTEALREELRSTPITVTTLCPGPVATGFGEAAGLPNSEAEKMLPKFLWVSAEKVAEIAIDGLDADRGVIVPGTANRIAARLYHHAPRRLLLPVLSRSHPALKKN